MIIPNLLGKLMHCFDLLAFWLKCQITFEGVHYVHHHDFLRLWLTRSVVVSIVIILPTIVLLHKDT